MVVILGHHKGLYCVQLVVVSREKFDFELLPMLVENDAAHD